MRQCNKDGVVCYHSQDVISSCGQAIIDNFWANWKLKWVEPGLAIARRPGAKLLQGSSPEIRTFQYFDTFLWMRHWNKDITSTGQKPKRVFILYLNIASQMSKGNVCWPAQCQELCFWCWIFVQKDQEESIVTLRLRSPYRPPHRPYFRINFNSGTQIRYSELSCLRL